ncbi:MAG: sulfite exporter TauE/SafE family protein [Patescibacteria group bacterium]
MLKEIKIKIENINSLNDKISIETEIEVLNGVEGVNINGSNGNCFIKFEEDKISKEEIFRKIESLNFKITEELFTPPFQKDKDFDEMENGKNKNAKEHVYFVKGMHCASCEILIEKKLLKINEIKSVEASTSNGQVVVEFKGDRPSPQRLNRLFKEDNYIFSDKLEAPNNNYIEIKKGANPTLAAFNIALFIIIGFLFLNKAGIAGLLNVSSKSSLLAFFGLGLLAGISSCAALVGGMVLSMSKQWQNIYSDKNTTYEKFQPHLLFNAGRIISYAVLGAALGMIGNKLQISFQFTSFLVIAISFLMLALSLQMLGVKAFRKFQFALPKSATRYIANEKNFQGRRMPFIMGAATFFLPCGFTITAQGLALLSGSWLQGSLIMLFFALGTAPMLLFIGLSSVRFSSKPHLAEKFSKVAGFLVLFFALFNINSQMNVLGYISLNNVFSSNQNQSQTAVIDEKNLPLIVDGKQVVKMNASSSGYSPNYIKVRAGIPVRWEVTDTGTSGCTNAIISNSLFQGSIDLTPGQVSIKEFTPTKPGKYKFSCWMGMVTGIIEVVPQSGSAAATAVAANNSGNIVNAAVADADGVVPSGAKGCGCGGGGGSCGAK